MNWRNLLVLSLALGVVGGCMPKDHDATQPPDVDKKQIGAKPLEDVGPVPGSIDPGSGKVTGS